MPVEFKDYYQVLGVRPDAPDEEIKRAFRALARKHHPDVAKDKRAGEDKFKEINEAYEVLGDPQNRKKYDRLGADWQAGGEPRPRAAGEGDFRGATGAGEGFEFRFEGTGFSDFFEHFFGGRAAGSRTASRFEQDWYAGGDAVGRHAAVRGDDVQGDILITLDEVLKGAMRAISVRRVNSRTGEEETQTYQVRIPAGVQAGQSIRLPGKGGEGLGGASSGDLYLRVRYAQHPDLSARGTDLVGHVEVAPWEAVLGATIPVRTLEGTLSLKIPPGTQQGTRLRVRGKGLPAGGAGRGDLYVAISIEVPSHVAPAQKALWEQLSRESAFNPRGVS